MKSTAKNGWHHPNTILNSQEVDGKLISIQGVYYHNDTAMEFVMRRQDAQAGRCAFRGSLTMLAPDGSPLYTTPPKAKGKKQNESEDNRDEAGNSSFDEKPSSSSEKKSVRAELNCKDDSLANLQKYIQKRAEKVYAQHILDLQRAYDYAHRTPISPETITPTQACRLYGPKFISERYPKASEKKNAERRNSLQQFYSGLINEPMCKYSARQIEAYIKENKYGKAAVKLAFEFWVHCIKNM